MEEIEVLLLEDTPVCYDSTRIFRQSLKKALEKNGCHVTCGQPWTRGPFAAIFGIQSTYPTLRTDQGGYFADETGIPFYQLILDHPLYHHDLLQEEIRNYHVLCLDEKHKAYLLRYYPHLQGVHVISLSLEPDERLDGRMDACWSHKQMDVLFTGTYTSPDEIRTKWEQLPQQIRGESWKLAQRMLEQPDRAQEDVLREMLAERPEISVTDQRFREAMSWYFLADTYAAAFYRDKIIRQLIENGTCLHLAGYGWQKLLQDGTLSAAAGKNMQLHGEIPYAQTAQLMQQARICLNIQPWFKAGIHDRILSAMGQGACVMTDGRAYLQQFFQEKKTIFYDDLTHPELMSGQIQVILQDEGMMRSVAAAAYQTVQHRFRLESQLQRIVQGLRN